MSNLYANTGLNNDSEELFIEFLEEGDYYAQDEHEEAFLEQNNHSIRSGKQVYPDDETEN